MPVINCRLVFFLIAVSFSDYCYASFFSRVIINIDKGGSGSIELILKERLDNNQQNILTEELKKYGLVDFIFSRHDKPPTCRMFFTDIFSLSKFLDSSVPFTLNNSTTFCVHWDGITLSLEIVINANVLNAKDFDIILHTSGIFLEGSTGYNHYNKSTLHIPKEVKGNKIRLLIRDISVGDNTPAND